MNTGNKRLALSVLVLFLGCSLTVWAGGQKEDPSAASAAGGKTTIQMWDPWSGADGPAMDRIIGRFNSQYSGKYEVVRTIKPDYKNELLAVLGTSGDAIPDIAGVHIDVFNLYQGAGYLEDLTALLQKNGLKRDDFATALWDAGTVEGKQYMVPLDTHPLVLFYNTKILAEIGKTPKDLENATAESILAMSKAAAAKGYVGYALNSAGWVPNEFMTFIYQQGRHIFEKKGDAYVPTINTGEGVKAAEVLRRFVTEKASNKAGEDHFNMFRSGQALFITDGTYVLNAFRESRDSGGAPFGVAPMFKITAGAKTQYWGGSHIFTVFTQDDMTDARREGIGLFLKYVADNAWVWGMAGQVPAYKPARQNAEYQGSELGPIANVADGVIPNDSPVATVVYDVMPTFMNQILWENKPVQATLDAAQREAEQKARAIMSQLKK